MTRLTEIKIRNAHVGPGEEALLAAGRNLFLRVRPQSRTWIVRVKRNGKRRVHTLGNWPDVTLKDATAKAANVVAVERGTARVNVSEAVEQYMDARIRSRYRRVAAPEIYATAATEALGKLAVNAARPVDISRAVADYRRTAPVSAMRFLSFLKGFFAWCVEFGYIDASPAALVRASAFGVEEKPRERILTDDEVRGYWKADDLPHARLLRFMLLTGLRIGEAQGAQVEEIDVEHWLTVPAERAKNKKAHRVYLTPLARQQIEADAAPYLFAHVTQYAVQQALRRWQKRREVASRWTPHDLRRSFASRCGDIGIAPHIISKLLNHTIVGTGSLPVYLRSEWLQERKAAAEALAKHIATVIHKRGT